MIFKSKLKVFFWLACFVVSNACVIIAVSSIEDVPAAIWGIIIGCDALFSTFVIMLKYILNTKDLKNYSEAIKELRKIGVNITARQLEKIVMAGFCFDENGQITEGWTVV